MTITHDAFDFPVQPLPAALALVLPLDIGPYYTETPLPCPDQAPFLDIGPHCTGTPTLAPAPPPSCQ